MKVDEITAKELSEMDPWPALLDVREAEELAICQLPHLRHIPLGELAARVTELDPEQDWIVYCHSGRRSAHATAYLTSLGFRRVRNLRGGILAYSEDVDPTIPKY